MDRRNPKDLTWIWCSLFFLVGNRHSRARHKTGLGKIGSVGFAMKESKYYKNIDSSLFPFCVIAILKFHLRDVRL